MKKLVQSMTAAGVLLTAGAAQAVSLTYANDSGGSIRFDGAGGFSFVPAPPGHSLQVTSGTASGLKGHISGTYNIGAVTTIAGLSTAPVTGSGVFTIVDGATPLTGSVSWVDISQFGVGNTLNILGSVNLTGISYLGTNPDLVALKNAGQAVNTVTFQFSSAVPLNSLKVSKRKTSFSGVIETVNVPDSGSSAMLLGIALIGLGAITRRVW